MGSVYKRRMKSGRPGRFYWIKYYRDGRPVCESSKSDDESVARRLLKAREGEVAASQSAALARAVARIPGAFPSRLFFGSALRELRGPLVYLFFSQGAVKYVGQSAGGLGRALVRSHHVLRHIPGGDGDALLYIPVATPEEAERLEQDCIAALRPEWNDGGAPRPEVTMAARRDAMAALAGTLSPFMGTPGVDGRPASVQNDSREALAQPGRAPAF
jgi:hypothetical protein